MTQTQIITLEYPGKRLDQALAAADPAHSRAQWQRLIKAGNVTIAGKPVKSNLKLGDSVDVTITLPPPAPTELIPEAIPLDIKYEDEHLLVVDKPAGMVVHPTVFTETGTLVHALLAHCPDLPGIGGEIRPGIVHRLDKDTSGLLVVAKTETTLRELQEQFKARTVDKTYVALVEGGIDPDRAKIDAAIGRDPRNRKRMAVIPARRTSARARDAQTSYSTMIAYNDFTLVECILHTGRTHQIRVHLAYIGFPIVGDTVYGRRKQRVKLSRHFLHAAKLAFTHPVSGERVSFSADLPVPLQVLLSKLDTD